MPFGQFRDNLNEFISNGRMDKENDFCPSGLIVDPFDNDKTPIYRVITGVSLRKSLIKKAIAMKANAIIVHHPNGWWFGDKNKCIAGNSQFAQYSRMLLQHNIALFGYHLPLDSHDTVGNNPSLFSMLELNKDITDRLAIGTDSNVPNVNKVRAAEKFLDGVGIIGRGKITDELLQKAFPKGYWSHNFTSGKEYKVAICRRSSPTKPAWRSSPLATTARKCSAYATSPNISTIPKRSVSRRSSLTLTIHSKRAIF